MNREGLVYRSLLVLAAAMLACDSDLVIPCGTSSSSTVGALRVLFIGNSATYYNNMPGMLEDIGLADSLPIETVDVSQGGFSLQDHWNVGWVRDTLVNGRWNVVVLQGGALETFAVTWANAIRVAEARPALYMPGPPRGVTNFPEVCMSYYTAAEEASAELYAAGEAWMEAWRTDPDLPLIGPDDIHPSEMGSYLAALTIYWGMTGREPPSLTNLGISAEDDAVLQAAAAAVQLTREVCM